MATMLGVVPRTMLELRAQKTIPYMKLSSRLIRYDPIAVRLALEKVTVRGSS